MRLAQLVTVLSAVLLAAIHRGGPARAATLGHRMAITTFALGTEPKGPPAKGAASLQSWAELGFARPKGAPFSFVCNGKRSEEVLPTWECSTRTQPGRNGPLQVVSYRDPQTGLLIEAHVARLFDGAAVDWVLHVSNTGSAETPLLEQLMPLDAAIGSEAPDARLTLRWSNGDRCAEDSFLPHDEVLERGKPRQFAAWSSNVTCLPFFNLKGATGGWVLAIGWTGNWKAEFLHDPGGAVRVRAGMRATRFRLAPGQRVRTPRILLLRWDGDALIDGHNRFRRLMLEHYVPRRDGRPAEPPVAYTSVAGLYLRAQAAKGPLETLNEAYELRMISKAADLGCEVYWQDAYWFPQPWHKNLGNWEPRPNDFPRGLRPLGDAAHQRGMKFLVWFAPLLVMPNTQFARQYPQFIHGGGEGRGGVWKLGDPAARQFLLDWISGCVRQWGIDIYREDIAKGMPPDKDRDRLGIPEMLHVEGLYTFWSSLLERHPGLLIDNCCGGGRRIDLETSSRAFTLWRSDFNDIGQGLKGKGHWPNMGRADQVMVTGLSLYVPFHTGPVWDMHPYSFRSAMSSGIVLYNDLESKDFSADLARQGIAELKQLRPYFQGDFYPLLPLGVSQADWYAYQLDRPDLGEGCILVFRRPESAEVQRQIRAVKIDPQAKYTVSITGETYEQAAPRHMTGRELSELKIRIDAKPGSALVRYKRR